MEVDGVDGHIPRINGDLTANYIDRNVLIVGELVSVENMKMKVRCCNGPIILVHLQEAIPANLAPGLKVQIEVTPKSKNVVNCNDFIVLQDDDQSFDMKLYNETIKLLIEQENENSYLINNVEEHWGSTNEKELDLVDAQNDSNKNQNGKSQDYNSENVF